MQNANNITIVKKISKQVINMKNVDDKKIAALGRIIKSNPENSKEERDKLVEMFMHHAEQICLKYSNDKELVDIAYLVLVEVAVQYWMKKRNMKFSTYLTYKIREKLFEERCKELNISKHTYKMIQKILKAETEFEQKNRRMPTDKELSDILQMSERKIGTLRVYLNQTKVIRYESEENGSTTQIVDQKSSENFLDIENEEFSCELQEVLSKFEKIDRDIFLLGLKLKNDTAFKWTEIKRRLGLDLTTDAIRNRYYKVRNELRSYYSSLEHEEKTLTQMKEKNVTNIKCETFADYVEYVMDEASKNQPGTEDDRRRWKQRKKEILNSYIGGRKEYHKAKHLKNYVNFKNRKFILLVFSFVLELSINDVELLLTNAGLSFSPYVEGDIEIKDCIVAGKYDIEVLRRYKR